MPVFARMNPDGTYRVDFLEPEDIGPEAADPGNAPAHVQRNLDRLEAYIRSDPGNSGEYFFWLDRKFGHKRGVPPFETARL